MRFRDGVLEHYQVTFEGRALRSHEYERPASRHHQDSPVVQNVDPGPPVAARSQEL